MRQIDDDIMTGLYPIMTYCMDLERSERQKLFSMLYMICNSSDLKYIDGRVHNQRALYNHPRND